MTEIDVKPPATGAASESHRRSEDERWNAITHGVGFLLAALGLPFLIVGSERSGGAAVFGVSIFGGSMLAMLAASTLYHASTSPDRRRRWRIADHASIYVLIAGSYTPLCLTSLRGIWGWTLLGTIWTMAVVGILLKLRFTGRYDRISTAMYLLMGWLCLVAAVPMVRLLQGTTLAAIVFAGFAFTIGVWFYLRDDRRGFHVLWHGFVLLGCGGLYAAMFLELVVA